MKTYRYPCTGNISIEGFGAFIEHEIKEPRRNLRMFAEELNSLIGSKYITLVNSGSSANLVAALTLAEKCRQNHKPLTAFASAFTFPTTVSSLLLAGFNVKLIDVERNGFNIDLEKIKEEPMCASVIAMTHFLGFPCKTKEICQYANANGCYVLQDACETLNLVSQKDEYSHCEYADITTLSFYHPHHLSSYGGGAVICNDKSDYIVCDSIAHWGRACKCHIDKNLCEVPDGPAHQFTYERLGVNVEMSELNACFGRWQLKNWSIIESQRIINYRLLEQQLSNHPNLQIWRHEMGIGSPFVFPIRMLTGQTVKEAWDLLAPKGVEIRTLMGGATCTQPAFMNKVQYGDKANAIEMANSTFFVGIHHTLSNEDVKTVACIIDKVFR